MNKPVLFSIAAAVAAISGTVAAQEVGKVISSTPVTREVAMPQKQCAPDANPRDPCRTVTNYETRTIGYKVVYEYAGRQHEVQLPFPPGPTIELDVTPAVQTMSSPSTVVPAGQISSEVLPERVYVDRVYREPVYVDDPYYYPARVYYPGYYSPVYPFLGVALGYSWGRSWGHGYGGRGWGHHR